jgi:hypothetical protein
LSFHQKVKNFLVVNLYDRVGKVKKLIPTQPTPKTAFIESQDRAMIDEVNRGFGFCALV